jgi:excisionase family DNA binding protein
VRPSDAEALKGVILSEQREWLTVNEFAETLGITRACVRRWLLERRLTSTRLGRLVRIPASEIARLVESGLRPARPAR